MISVFLDGEEKTVLEGTKLGDILVHYNPDLVVAVILPGKKDSLAGRNYLVQTSAGEVIIEGSGEGNELFSSDVLLTGLHWRDQRSIHFGPFPSHIVPVRQEARYERGDVIIGCGGYEPERSYLVFASRSHIADHGARQGGGVIGQVVSGLGVLDRLKAGDIIESIKPVLTFSDSTESYTTTDPNLVLLPGMHIISYLRIEAKGYSDGRSVPEAPRSVEHLMLGCRGKEYWTSLSSSTHIRDDLLAGTDVPHEVSGPRYDGAVTIRTTGKKRGSIYLYTEDIPQSRHHTVVGQVIHGIELARVVHAGERFRVEIIPEQFDLLGLSLADAKEFSERRGVTFTCDDYHEQNSRDLVVIHQDPETTMEILFTGSVSVTTTPYANVIDVMLDDMHAYSSCKTFREVTGLKFHPIGKLPHIFSFEDVYLFKAGIPMGTTINPENTPEEGTEIAAGTLAMTNDSRRSTGIVGVRTESNDEFGPTSEPFSGTNIIGRILDLDKLKKIVEGETVYFREGRE